MESTSCPKCDLFVFEEDSIFCDICRAWFHISCTTINRKTFNILKDDNSDWYCQACLKFSLPFQNCTNNVLVNFSFNSNISFLRNIDSKCDICYKEIVYSIDSVVKCKGKNHFIHSKCSNVKELELIGNKFWYCEKCNVIPFASLCDDSFADTVLTNDIDIFSPVINNDSMSFDDLPKINIPNIYSDYVSNLLTERDCDDSMDSFKYYSMEDFRNLVTKNTRKISFSVFHTNIRSVSQNHGNLNIFLNNLDFNFDIIVLTETWGKYIRGKSLALQNYHAPELLTGKSQNSGCALYIKNTLMFKNRLDLNICFHSQDEEFVCQWIEIINKNGKNLLIAAIYRHPKTRNYVSFQDYLKETMKKIKSEGKEAIVSGDFNINLLKFELDLNVDKFLNLFLTTTLNQQLVNLHILICRGILLLLIIYFTIKQMVTVFLVTFFAQSQITYPIFLFWKN